MQEDINKQLRKEHYEAFIKRLVEATGCSRKTAKEAIYHTGTRREAYQYAEKTHKQKRESKEAQNNERI